VKHSLLSVVFLLSSLRVFAQSPEWTSFFNNSASANEFITDVAFDNLGNTYLSGYGNMISGQSSDFLTVKCNSAGVQEWAKIYNGPQSQADEASANQ
jgi:hypothetical protein